MTVRLDGDLARSLESEARRRRVSKCELVRELLIRELRGEERLLDLARVARVQSLRVSDRRSEEEALAFAIHAADTRGWK